MRIRSANKIKDKIKELEDTLKPHIKYNIHNEIYYTIDDSFNALETKIKIDALK